MRMPRVTIGTIMAVVAIVAWLTFCFMVDARRFERIGRTNPLADAGWGLLTTVAMIALGQTIIWKTRRRHWTMNLPRFRIRTLMIAAAVVALMAFGYRLHRQSSIHKLRSRNASEHESSWRFVLNIQSIALANIREERKSAQRASETLPGFLRTKNQEFLRLLDKHEIKAIKDRDESMERIEYYVRLQQKYERAARYPWLHVEPDPPEPK